MEQVQLITLAEPLPAPVALVRRARLLAGIGLAWHTVEAAVAIGAGVVAGSVALVGFGADSLIEMLAGATLLWRFAASRAGSHTAEHAARRTIGASFFVVAAYVAVDATPQLALAVGLIANAALHWWWADPVAALLIAAVAAREGVNAWRGDDSCCEAAF